MVFVIGALVAILLLQVLPWVHVRQVATVWPHIPLSAHDLKRIAGKPWADRLQFASSRLGEEGWAPSLCTQLRTADTPDEHVFLVNTALHELEHALMHRQRWPQTCNRLSLLLGGLFLALGLAMGRAAGAVVDSADHGRRVDVRGTGWPPQPRTLAGAASARRCFCGRDRLGCGVGGWHS